jgi:hypothetical protein
VKKFRMAIVLALSLPFVALASQWSPLDELRLMPDMDLELQAGLACNSAVTGMTMLADDHKFYEFLGEYGAPSLKAEADAARTKAFDQHTDYLVQAKRHWRTVSDLWRSRHGGDSPWFDALIANAIAHLDEQVCSGVIENALLRSRNDAIRRTNEKRRVPHPPQSLEIPTAEVK